MGMSVEIPTGLQPAIEAAIAKCGYANEQELVSEILRAAVPALEAYGQLRRGVQASVQEIEAPRVAAKETAEVHGNRTHRRNASRNSRRF